MSVQSWPSGFLWGQVAFCGAKPLGGGLPLGCLWEHSHHFRILWHGMWFACGTGAGLPAPVHVLLDLTAGCWGGEGLAGCAEGGLTAEHPGAPLRSLPDS